MNCYHGREIGYVRTTKVYQRFHHAVIKLRELQGARIDH
jgi:hypothetical protein